MSRGFAASLFTAVLLGAGAGAALAQTGGSTVQWAGRTFTSVEELAGWLRVRGESYEQWATAHPRAAAVLEREVAHPAPAPRTTPAPAPGGVSSFTVGLAVAGTLAVLLILIATVPVPGALDWRLEPRRLELAFFGLAVLVGIAITFVVRHIGSL